LANPALVGRDVEMATLCDALADLREGRGGVVFLVGEPGLGKTRLLRETAWVAAEAGQLVLRGRATTPSAQFRALSEALFSILRHRGVPEFPELAPYRHALSRLVPEWRMERVPGPDDSLVVLAEAVLRLLRSVDRGSGCVLLLDDLHEADDDTLGVVDYLADNLAGEPIALVGTVRPGPSSAVDLVTAAVRRGVATALELSYLDSGQVRGLVDGCLAGGVLPVDVLSRLVEQGGGNPFYVQELLAWHLGRADLDQPSVVPQTYCRVPATVLASVTARVDRLGAHGREVLRAAAIFGQHFHVELVAVVAGVDEAVMVEVLRSAVDARLLDPVDRDTCAFRHVLTADALCAGMLPRERAALAARAARAIERAHPDLPGEWCLLAGELWEEAGDTAQAAELLAAAGRRALSQGGLSTATSLLERSMKLLEHDVPSRRAGVLEPLVDALLAAGQVMRAAEVGAHLASVAEPEIMVTVHLRLARAAAAAGEWRIGQHELDLARTLVGAGTEPATTAPVDVVAAQLAFTDPAPERLVLAEELATRAWRAASEAEVPEIACEALEVLGICARVRDLDKAEDLFNRALAIAERHDLVLWRIRLHFHLAAQSGIRSADPTSLRAARDLARTAGALVTDLDIVAELAMVHITRGEYDEAERYAGECAETARRLRLGDMVNVGLGLRVCVSAHRGHRAETTARLAAYEELAGTEDEWASVVWGFGVAFCSLLEEEPARAAGELERAVAAEVNRPPQYVSYAHGPRLLLAVLAGTQGWSGVAALRRSAGGQARWNRAFLMAATVVLEARDGRLDEASRAVKEFAAVAAPFPLVLHLGFRLLAAVAIDGGWGEPAPWLRAADEFFHTVLPAPRVTAACRALLRRAGEPVPQRRRGSDQVPAGLRRLGVTVREYEVLTLVAARLSNREISARLFVSHRTIDTHVSKLLTKTGQPDRQALARYAADFLCEPTADSQ
jgi:DNA-binding CsgD family transcriptional regulator/tetratricopeptide (TPR) repeat protein